MSNHNSNGYYGGSYYTGSEEGPVGNTGNREYQPPNPADISANLQVTHHAIQPEGGYQSAAWFPNMYMAPVYSRPSSQEALYNGHAHYMSQYSPEEAPVVPSSINMPPMIAPQPGNTPSPNAITNGHDHHPSPTYYSPYLGIAPMPGAPEGVTGCPADADSTTHNNLSSDSANMAMQALTLNSVRGPFEENAIPQEERSSVDWTRRRFQPAEQQSGVADATTGVVEGVEIKQEVADQTWRAGEMVPRPNSRSSTISPLRGEEQEARENNWKAAGKTRTKDKYRVVYSDHQRVELEREFHYGRYITIRRKAELALQLGLSERQVKIWFQNRRAKERKLMKKSNLQENNEPRDPPPPTHQYTYPRNDLGVYAPLKVYTDPPSYPPHGYIQPAKLQIDSRSHLYPMYEYSRFPNCHPAYYSQASRDANSPNLGPEEESVKMFVENSKQDIEIPAKDLSVRPKHGRKR